jgi:hypothetical protein
MSSALAVDRGRGPSLLAEFQRPGPEKRPENKSPLPPEWSDSAKPLRDIAERLKQLIGAR